MVNLMNITITEYPTASNVIIDTSTIQKSSADQFITAVQLVDIEAKDIFWKYAGKHVLQKHKNEDEFIDKFYMSVALSSDNSIQSSIQLFNIRVYRNAGDPAIQMIVYNLS